MLSLKAVTTPPKYKPRIPSARTIPLATSQLLDGDVEEEIWVRHFTISVGVLTTQVARPPMAPAAQAVPRLAVASGPPVFRKSVVRL